MPDINIRQYSKEEFPITLNLSLNIAPAKTTTYFSIFFMVLGLIILAVGAWLMMFGPDSIIVHGYRSITFYEFLQLNPGAIVTVGFAVVAIGRVIQSGQAQKKMELMETQLLSEAYKQLSFGPDSLTDTQALYFLQVSDNTYEVSIQEVEPATTANGN